MSNYAVEVNHVSMKFNINKEGVDNAKEYFIRLLKHQLHFMEFWALKDVSFKVEKGDRVGILGFNGAGKSTLLKVIAGVLKPTQGSVRVEGVVAPMLELGAGFDGNYSGRENVFLYAATMGFSRKFIEKKYDEIVEFAELEDFIDAPLKGYTSGMRARLGFAIATAVKPDVLILDEVLSVGDAAFRAKSQKRIESMMGDGVTVLYVSHSTDKVEEICNKAIILDHGQMIAAGDSVEISKIYQSMTLNK